MISKEIRFKASVDFQDFDKQVQEMQRRMAEMNRPSDAMRANAQTLDRFRSMGVGAGATPQDRMRAAQEEREAERRRQQELTQMSQRYSDLNRLVDYREKKMAEISKHLQNETTDLREKVRLQERLGVLTQQQGRNMAEQQAIQKAVAGMSPGGPAAGGGGGLGALGQLLGPSAAIGTLTKILQGMASMPSATLSHQAAVASNTYGQLTSSMFSGNLQNDMLWKVERARADDMAKQQTMKDKLIRYGGSALLIGGGIGVGLGTAGFGSPLAAGMIASGLAGLGHTGYKSATGGFEADAAQRLQENLANEKAINPAKDLASQMYSQRLMQTVGNMRRLGMGESQYFGMLQNNASQGITMDQSLAMIDAIQGSGGSTTAMRGMSGQAAILARNQGITNAGQLIGTLSAGMSNGATENSLIRILSEAQRIGLNKSDLVEEQRKFMQTTVQIGTSLGARTVAGQGAIAGMMALGTEGQMSTLGIQGAGAALQQYTQLGTTGSGIRGVIGSQFISSSKVLKKLNPMSRALIQNTNPETILSDPDMMAYLKTQTGASEEDFRKELYGLMGAKQDVLGDNDKIVSRIKKIESKTGPRTAAEEKELIELRGQLKVGQRAFQQIGFGASVEEGSAYAKMTTGAGRGAALARGIGGAPTDAAEKTVSAIAAQNDQTLQMVSKMQGAFAQAADDGAKFAQSMAKAVSDLLDALESKDKSKIKSARSNVEGLSKMMSQPQAGPVAK